MAFSSTPAGRGICASISCVAGDASEPSLRAGTTDPFAGDDRGAPLLEVFGRVIAAAEELVEHLVPNDCAVGNLLAGKKNPMDVPPVAVVLPVSVNEGGSVRDGEPGDAGEIALSSGAIFGGPPPFGVGPERRECFSARREVG